MFLSREVAPSYQKIRKIDHLNNNMIVEAIIIVVVKPVYCLKRPTFSKGKSIGTIFSMKYIG